jgi:hypothetical protein
VLVTSGLGTDSGRVPLPHPSAAAFCAVLDWTTKEFALDPLAHLDVVVLQDASHGR